MAAAEARAAWQRTVNRYFVQEDAKRAPKLACCQSSSSSSKQDDVGSVSGGGQSENPLIGFMPLKRNPSFPNIPPHAKWWLQIQPNYSYQKGLTCEQLSLLDAELESIKDGINSTAKDHGIHPQKNEIGRGHLVFNTNYKVSTTSIENDLEIKEKELNALYGEKSKELLSDMSSYCEVSEMDYVESSYSKQTNEPGFDLEFPWLEAQSTEPWWKTADRDELASLVARKSLDHVENCDLPRPQNTRARGNLLGKSGHRVHGGVIASSFNKTCNSGLSEPAIHAQDNLSSISSYGMKLASVEETHLKCSSENPFSHSTVHSDMLETAHTAETDPSKSQLFEALCHSQTRAREAEKAAKQANVEKEHIMKLFFKQASQLFAYKQWFQLLQLESFYFELKTHEPPITLLPVLPAWMPHKARTSRKNWHKTGRVKRNRNGGRRLYIGKYALAFALGLSLVGAGLLLGWTVGWMLPTL